MCFREIVQINLKAIKHIIVYQLYGTVKVIKSKLIIVVLKERKGFHAHVLMQNR